MIFKSIIYAVIKMTSKNITNFEKKRKERLSFTKRLKDSFSIFDSKSR